MHLTRSVRIIFFLLLSGSFVLGQAKPAGGSAAKKEAATTPSTAGAKGAPTVKEAEAFMTKAEAQLDDLGVRASRAQWVQENFITDDTETMSAQAQEHLTAVV